uniref:Uncharacterized protein n=1 Tax=Anguilla anguilla TaxID=7936 RepID=A0A0E9QKH5_ANGAN
MDTEKKKYNAGYPRLQKIDTHFIHHFDPVKLLTNAQHAHQMHRKALCVCRGFPTQH